MKRNILDVAIINFWDIPFRYERPDLFFHNSIYLFTHIPYTEYGRYILGNKFGILINKTKKKMKNKFNIPIYTKYVYTNSKNNGIYNLPIINNYMYLYQRIINERFCGFHMRKWIYEK